MLAERQVLSLAATAKARPRAKSGQNFEIGRVFYFIDGIQYSGATVAFFRAHPPFPMFSWRLRGGLECFNVLTRAIVFNWVVIRLTLIVSLHFCLVSLLYALHF